MTKYREILRLFSNELKTNEIVNACSVSKKTVIKVKKRATGLGISWPLSDDMTDEKLKTNPQSLTAPNICRMSNTSTGSFYSTA